MTDEGAQSSEEVFFDSGDAVLAGDIWLPRGDVRAGVVMIGGSGATDRTNGGYFVPYRGAFQLYGLAGLWYDKRGSEHLGEAIWLVPSATWRPTRSPQWRLCDGDLVLAFQSECLGTARAAG